MLFLMGIVTNLIESGTALVWQIRREIKNIREDDMAQDNYMTWPSLAVDFAAGIFSTYAAVCTFIRAQRGQYEFSDGSAYDLMGIVAGPIFAVTAVVYAVQKARLRRRLSRGQTGEKSS